MSDLTDRARLEAGAEITPIIPRTIEEVARIADAVVAAGMVPASYEAKEGTAPERAKATKAKLMLGVMKGLEVGFGPITALSTIFIVNNRPCLWGDGAVALCERGHAVEWIKHRFEGEEGKDDWTAIYEIKRRGHDEPYAGRFSVKDAKRAHLWNNTRKTPWIEYPQRMLLARARAFALREGFADYLMGLSIAEEAQDLPAPPAPALALDFLDDRAAAEPAAAPPGRAEDDAPVVDNSGAPA